MRVNVSPSRLKVPPTVTLAASLAVALITSLAACNARYPEQAPATGSESPASVSAPAEGKLAQAPADESPTGGEAEGLSADALKADALKQQAATDKALPRKIIRNGEVDLVVKAYAPTRQAIERLVRQAGGYISQSEVHHGLGSVSSATLVLRIPSAGFGGLLPRILELGVVRRESTSSQDVTEQYVDLQARLANARKLETRLLELLKTSTGKVSDLLQVERELARVRESIERFTGKLRLLNDQIDLSTLTVRLSIQQRYTPPRPPTLGSEMRQVLVDSWDALKGFGRTVVLLAVALLPWLLPITLLLWLLVRWIRKRRGQRAARQARQAGPRT